MQSNTEASTAPNKPYDSHFDNAATFAVSVGFMPHIVKGLNDPNEALGLINLIWSIDLRDTGAMAREPSSAHHGGTAVTLFI